MWVISMPTYFRPPKGEKKNDARKKPPTSADDDEAAATPGFLRRAVADAGAGGLL